MRRIATNYRITTMTLVYKKSLWTTGIISALLFAALFSIRIGLVTLPTRPPSIMKPNAGAMFSDRESWMTISRQNHKIGFSHTILSKTEKGFRLIETIFLRINTMGMVHDIDMKTEAALNQDFSVAGFDFTLGSGRFDFNVKGSFSEGVLFLSTRSAGTPPRSHKLEIHEPPYLSAGIIEAVRMTKVKPGDTLRFHVFDPASMGREPVTVRVLDEEDLISMGQSVRATVVRFEFKGITQNAWIAKNGDVLKESGFMGIVLEKSSREEALAGLSPESEQDLVEAASIAPDRLLSQPEHLEKLTIRIRGVSDITRLRGGRQFIAADLLTIQKESILDLPVNPAPSAFGPSEKRFLVPTPFIQSDHPKIVGLVKTLAKESDTPLQKVRKIMGWIGGNIEKRPVISLPDALSCLVNRAGDCNEHAVLMAAMARAAGIPAAVETGLVYLKGRFYYHAWNLLYLGRWITVDPVFGQIPADVTHIRLAGGEAGEQLELAAMIGNLSIEVIRPEKGGAGRNSGR